MEKSWLKPTNEPEWFLPTTGILPGSVEFSAWVWFSKRIAEFFRKFTASIQFMKVCIFPSSFWYRTISPQTAGNVGALNKLLSSAVCEKGFFYVQFAREEEEPLFPACKNQNSSSKLIYKITEINSTCHLYSYFRSSRIKDFLGKPDWYLHFSQLQLLGGEKNT